MTIGIGFKCIDGIVIAADTQYTRGAYKGHGPKLFPFSVQGSGLAVVVAGAGRVAFMTRAVDKIRSALAGHPSPTLRDVQKIVEDELLDFFETYIYPKPDYSKDQAWFDLIVGVWTKADGFGLFKTEDVTVNPVMGNVSGHCTIGNGFSVAEYALGLTYRQGLNVEDAKFVAALCIKAAKDYVDYCGGITHIYTLKDGAYRRVISPEVKDAEQYSEDLIEVLQYMSGFLDPESLPDDGVVADATDLLKKKMIEFRNKKRERKERMIRTLKELNRLNQL